MKRFLTLLLALSAFTVWSQDTLTFETFSLGQDTFIDPLTIEGEGFSAGEFFLPRDTGFGFWLGGWAVSTKTDSLSSGIGNQYSARPGGGAAGSEGYGVATSSAVVQYGEGGFTPVSMQVTNSTYAHNSMRDGDQFAKKFGGETGDDPDFFRLIIQKYLGDSLYADSVVFYLADFRFEDNSQDYIVSDWETVNLDSLGVADSLFFRFETSDVGEFGPNTPFYFCMDNLTVREEVTSIVDWETIPLAVYPNPTTGALRLDVPDTGQLTLWHVSGQRLIDQRVWAGTLDLSLHTYETGLYLLRWTDGERVRTAKIQLR